MRLCFAAYGLPDEVVSDNGLQFISQEFTDFLKQNGVKQTLVPPYHPSSNGAAERTVQILKRALRKHAESVRRGGKKLSLKHQLANGLFQYRNTPHSVTGVTPSKTVLETQTSHQVQYSPTTSKADSSDSMIRVMLNCESC